MIWDRLQSRRGILATVGSFAMSGCLRLSNSTTSADFVTREEAISTAGAFADSDSYDIAVPNGSNELIEPAKDFPLTTSTNGPEESKFTSSGLVVVPRQSEVTFSSESALRVKELHSETQTLFTPIEETPTVEFIRLSIGFDPTGGIDTSYPQLDLPENDLLNPNGSWNNQLDTVNIFGIYIIEIIEGGTVIGRTEPMITAVGYQYGVAQTRESAFITRDPSVDESWSIEFSLDGTNATTTGIHHPSENVFEIDLTDLDVANGEYTWDLDAYREHANGNEYRTFKIRGRGPRQTLVIA